MSELAETFRKEKKERNLSLGDLSEATGIRTRTILEFENGKSIATAKAEKLFAAMGLKLAVVPADDADSAQAGTGMPSNAAGEYEKALNHVLSVLESLDDGLDALGKRVTAKQCRTAVNLMLENAELCSSSEKIGIKVTLEGSELAFELVFDDFDEAEES